MIARVAAAQLGQDRTSRAYARHDLDLEIHLQQDVLPSEDTYTERGFVVRNYYHRRYSVW